MTAFKLHLDHCIQFVNNHTIHANNMKALFSYKNKSSWLQTVYTLFFFYFKDRFRPIT